MQPIQMIHSSLRGENGNIGSIELTPLEDAVCQLIDDTCRWISRTHPQPDSIESGGLVIPYVPGWTCEARIAGGWVRDKLLGQASHDFDISLSTLTGHTFALLLRDYMLSDEFRRSTLASSSTSPFHHESSVSSELIGHVTKIAANPEQSKNLETATAKLAGLQLDFVNLRKEVYLGDSRIPTMQFGTAEEDAERRDITINALFFNVHTRTIEDLTGKGLDDMRKGIIRTPLHPNQTFLDDPLRVLRCIRFASRFGYTVDDAIFQCMRGQDGIAIREALKSKVSRERFGIEFEKMLKGPDPWNAVDLIDRMGLFDVVLGPPPGSIIRNAPTTLDKEPVKRALAILKFLSSDEARATLDDVSFGLADHLHFIVRDCEARFFLFYSALLLPLRDAEWQEKKDKWFWAGECIIANGLKHGRSVRDILSAMWRSAKILRNLSTESFDATSSDYRGRSLLLFTEANASATPISARATRAMLIKATDPRKSDVGLTSETVMAMNLFWALIADLATDVTSWSVGSEVTLNQIDTTTMQEVLRSDKARAFAKLLQQVEREKIFERIKQRPLLNGKEVIDLLRIAPGAFVSRALGYVEAWQYDQEVDVLASVDVKERCKAWLLQEWDKGEIVPFDQRVSPKAASTKKKQKGV